MFFSSIPEAIENLKHIFRTLKIYVGNTHNHLITPEKHSSWPPEYLLHVLPVHLAGHLAGHLADGPPERLIDYLVSSSIIVDSSRETAYSSFLACSVICLMSKSSDVCS